MKIIHIQLASPFTEGLKYQENLLIEQNTKDGNDVLVVASCYMYSDGQLTRTYPCSKVTKDKYKLIRLPYVRIINSFFTNKIRKVKGLYEIIKEFNPDVILHHSVCDWEMFTVANYKKRNPRVKLYCDSHADFYTSATNWLSRNILHRVFYKLIIRKNICFIDKVFSTSKGCDLFLNKIYKVSKDKREVFIQGGVIPETQIKKDNYKNVRKELEIGNKEIMLVQVGKLDSNKKIIEMLDVFQRVNRADMKFVIIGSVSDDIKNDFILRVASLSNVQYIGWKNGDEMLKYLCAADVYVQPGKVSAILESAICTGCAVIVNYFPDYDQEVTSNGYLTHSILEVEEKIRELTWEKINIMKAYSELIAQELLDNAKLAKRLYA